MTDTETPDDVSFLFDDHEIDWDDGTFWFVGWSHVWNSYFATASTTRTSSTKTTTRSARVPDPSSGCSPASTPSRPPWVSPSRL